jgi:hypothetical protein
MLINEFSRIKTTIAHLVLATVFGVYIYFGISSFQNPMVSNYQLSLQSFTDYYINTLDYNFLIYFSFIAIIYMLVYIEKVKKTEESSTILSTNLESTKLKVLQAQIHPNFLFNGLNTISSLMKTNVQLAQNTTENLGDYLREVLIYKDQKFISVKNDIQLINKYIDIMKMRYPDQLSVNIKIDKNVEDCYIPSMILQPIIEIFITNGFKYNKESLNIEIQLINIDKKTNITIINNGKQNKQKEFSKRPFEDGVSNLKKRLQFLFPNEFSLSIKNLQYKSGVRANIIFPCKSREEIENDKTGHS